MTSGGLTLTILQATLALGLLYGGGELLVRGASALALRFGVSPLAVGLTVVAFGTSLPELVVSLDAALSGANDISTGNVVGSNIANIALILGLAALLRPMGVESKVVRLDMPISIGVSLVLVGVLADGEASSLEGILLVVGLAGYTGFTFWESRRETPPVRDELAAAAPAPVGGVAISIVQVAGGLVALVVGGHLLVVAAVALAGTLGVSEAAVGLTIVAVGTSLPELATTVVASLRGQGDIAVGNVVGSNIFNILGIIGVTAIVRPLATGGLSAVDLAAMVALPCVLMALLYGRHRLGRTAGAGLLAVFVGYTGFVLGS
jgi:cation:H+ antiporter